MVDTLPVPSAQVVRIGDASLPSLAETICAAHAAVAKAVTDAAHQAVVCGRALIAAKAQVPKGEWAIWVRSHCDIGERHVRRYIALAEAFDASGHTVSGDLVGLSLRGLMRQLTPAKKREGSSGFRIPKPSASPNPKSPLSVSAFTEASPGERRHFVDNVGWLPLAEAIPQSWYPEIMDWLLPRLRPAEAAPVEHAGGLATPADLSIPVFLCRSQPKQLSARKPKKRAAPQAEVVS